MNTVTLTKDDPATLELQDVLVTLELAWSNAKANNPTKINTVIRSTCAALRGKAQHQTTLNVLADIRKAWIPSIELNRALGLFQSVMNDEVDLVVVGTTDGK